MATMEVILATKIEGLGAEADLVTVKAGYGRNYLIPKGLAHEATASNRRFIANLQAARAKREAEELSAAQEVAAKISGLTVDLTLEVGQGGKAFGAITNQNIHDALTAQGVEVDRRRLNSKSRSRAKANTKSSSRCIPRWKPRSRWSSRKTPKRRASLFRQARFPPWGPGLFLSPFLLPFPEQTRHHVCVGCHSTSCTASFHPPTEINGMIRLYRQTPEGIERTTQVDAAEQHLDSVFWIDLLTPEPAEIKFVERLCGLEMPTYDEMREIEATSRLYTEDGARFMTTTVLSRVDTESPSLSEITFVLMGAKIITIRHSDSYSFRVFSHQLLRQKQISRDQVFTGLLETIVDRQADVLERFGAELDRLSKNIFRRDEPEGKASKRVPVSSALRLTLQDLGRVGDLLTRQRDCLVNLLRLLTYASNEEALDDTNSTLYIKLRPLSRDVTSLSEYANFLSSNVNFMLDAVLGLINIEQNEIVKIFTVAAVVFMPPTLIASIYGMNFAHMPGLENEYGYYISLVVMLVSIILPLVYFRSRRLL